MDTMRTSTCLGSQSMATKDICILVVHNDPVYRHIILKMLENCSHYEVIKFKKIGDALNTIQEKKEWLSIVVTDAHRSVPSQFEILKYIEKEFNLPVIPMMPRQSTGVMPVGLDSDAKLFIVKSLSVNEFKIHWEHAYTKEGGKTSFQSESVVQERETGISSQIYSLVHEVIREDQNDKKLKFEEADEQSEEDKDDAPHEKKPRVIWNEAMQHKLLKAVQLLGHDRPFPKKILEIINVPGLTIENVASHLQKYRMCLKRAKGEMQSTSSIYGINSTPLRYIQSNHSGFISSETNHQEYHTQKPLLTSNQPRLNLFSIPNFSSPETLSGTSNTQSNMCPINTNMPLSNIFSNYPEASITTANLGQQNFVTANNNQVSLIFPDTHNSPVINTTQIHSSPLTNENPQPDFSNNTRYVGLRVTANGELADCDQTSAPKNNVNAEDKGTLLTEGNGNESLVEFPSTEIGNNSEQQFNVPPAEFEIEDMLDETGGLTIPDILFDFDDSLL